MLCRNCAVLVIVLALSVVATSRLFGAPFTVNSVGVMDPNPYSLTIIDNTTNVSTTPGGTGVTLAQFQTLMQGDNGAFARDNGGVLDAQQIWQGGSWPANANGNNAGTTMGDTSGSPITVTYGATQANTIQFWRDIGATLNTVGIDSNANNGNAVVSGGGRNSSGGGAGTFNFATGIFNDNTETAASSVAAGGGYIGIQGATPVGLVFNNGVAPVGTPVSNVTAIGITQVPRFAVRNFEIIATFSDATTWDSGSINYPNDGTTANFVGIQAPAGQTITRIDLLGTAGLTRFDDLAFITTAPADLGGWKTSTGASWNSTSNWATGIIPNAVGASASFRGTLTTSGNVPLGWKQDRGSSRLREFGRVVHHYPRFRRVAYDQQHRRIWFGGNCRRRRHACH